MKSFHGYIGSLKQNEADFSYDGNNMHTYHQGLATSSFITKPASTLVWYFLYQKVPGRSKTHKANGIKAHYGDFTCAFTVPSAFNVTPSILWYKDGKPINTSSKVQIRLHTEQTEIASTVYLLPNSTLNSASGVYSCVAKSGSYRWLLMNHVICVVTNEPTSLLGIFARFLGVGETFAVFILIAASILANVLIILFAKVINRLRTPKAKWDLLSPTPGDDDDNYNVDNDFDDEQLPLMDETYDVGGDNGDQGYDEWDEGTDFDEREASM